MLRAFKTPFHGLLLLPLWLCPGLAAADLLTNGGFEEPAITGPWSRLNNIPGWTGSFDLHRDLPAADGAQVVDINQNSQGWIAQTFATASGAQYELRFSHGVNYYCQSSALFAVEIDGVELGRFTTGRELQEKSLSFTAADSETELRFRSLSGGCGATTIDNVSVTGDGGCVADYSFMLPFNNRVISLDEAEVAARVWRPCDGAGGPHPLLVFMHGQHSDCSGPCNEGFDYLAAPLANDGFVVVSIKVSLPGGIESSYPLQGTYRQDPSLTVMRGRLLLAHLEHWMGWTDPAFACQSDGSYCAPASLAGGGDGLRGLVDWTRVGLLGHSRGGEAVRAAYNLLNPAGTDIARMDSQHQYAWPASLALPQIRAIFEFAPVDRTTSGPRNEPFLIDANGVAWHVMLPACDGDIERLSGIMPFDRMLAARRDDAPGGHKSAMTVWGANHAFFNSRLPDPENQAACSGDGNVPLAAAQQQELARIAVHRFFRAHVRDLSRPLLFNPLHRTVEWQQMSGITTIERSFSVTPHVQGHVALHDFGNAARISAAGSPAPTFDVDDLRNLDPRTEHDPVQRALAVEWVPPGGAGSAPTLSIVRGPVNVQDFCSLDFRIARQPGGLNVAPATDFSLQLLYGTGKGAPAPGPALRLGGYLNLAGPAGGGPFADPHAVLQTVRIPLRDFGVADLSRVRGLRLVFGDTPTGAIYLANMRFERACD